MATCMDLDVDVDVLRRLATWRGGRALIRTDYLGEALKMEQDAALDLAAELEAAGLLSVWDVEDSTYVILSSLAAERLGIVLWPPCTDTLENAIWVPIGRDPRDETPPWKVCHVPRGETAPCVVIETNIFPRTTKGGTSSPGLDGLVDPKAEEPYRTAEKIEASTAVATIPLVRREATPYHILGCDQPWPLHVDDQGRCNGCGGHWHDPGSVCLVCGRGWTDKPDARPIKETWIDPYGPLTGAVRPKKPGRAKPMTPEEAGDLMVACGMMDALDLPAVPAPPTAPFLDPKPKPKPKRTPRRPTRRTPATTRPANIDLRALRASLDASTVR